MTDATTAPTSDQALDAQSWDALLASPPPQHARALSASLTFATRSLLKIKHVPEQLGDVIGIPVLFTLMFTYLFGGALAGSTGHYLQFLLPGTLVLAVLFVTAGRYLLASSLVIGLGLIMGYRAGGGPGGVLAAVALVLLFAFALSWVWTTLGLVLRTPNAVLNIGFVVLFPLTFMSNVFVDPHTMPSWLRAIADANPISHLATAARALMAGTPAGAQVLWVLGSAAALTVVFAPLTTWLYQRRS